MKLMTTPTLPIGLQNKVIGECDGVDGIYSATANTASICDAVTEKIAAQKLWVRIYVRKRLSI